MNATTLKTSAAHETTKKLIASVWRRNRDQVLQRLTVLDIAAAAALQNLLTPALKREAASVAHKLAGSLGMFGFGEGTLLARELEKHLEDDEPNGRMLATLAHRLRAELFS